MNKSLKASQIQNAENIFEDFYLKNCFTKA